MRKGFRSRFARFVADHITWEFLVWMLANQWSAGLSVILPFLGGAALWLKKQPTSLSALGGTVLLAISVLARMAAGSLTKKGIAEIRFDYLPERSPEENGWELVLDQGTTHPAYSLAGEAPEQEKCLYAKGLGYRLDYRLELHESLCKFVRYSAKLTDTSVVYANVRMSSREGHNKKDGWIAYRFEAPPVPTKEADNEWKLRAEGKTLSQPGWRVFRRGLEEDVERTFGTEGWIYERLLRIRLRGTISISPIRLLE